MLLFFGVLKKKIKFVFSFLIIIIIIIIIFNAIVYPPSCQNSNMKCSL